MLQLKMNGQVPLLYLTYIPSDISQGVVLLDHMTALFLFYFFVVVLLFICAYKAWVISPPYPHLLPYHPLRPLPLPPSPSIPSRNYFALISNFVEERI
jgi:hypothetical protein